MENRNKFGVCWIQERMSTRELMRRTKQLLWQRQFTTAKTILSGLMPCRVTLPDSPCGTSRFITMDVSKTRTTGKLLECFGRRL